MEQFFKKDKKSKFNIKMLCFEDSYFFLNQNIECCLHIGDHFLQYVFLTNNINLYVVATYLLILEAKLLYYN